MEHEIWYVENPSAGSLATNTKSPVALLPLRSGRALVTSDTGRTYTDENNLQCMDEISWSNKLLNRITLYGTVRDSNKRGKEKKNGPGVRFHCR